MRRHAYTLCLLLCSILLMGAAYRIKTVKIRPIESYPAQTTASGITVAADPYTTDERSYKAFDYKKLNSRGYFPVHVIIQNNTQDFWIVRTRNIVLITESAEHVYTVPGNVVAEDLFSGSDLDKMPDKPRKPSKTTRPGTPLSDFTEKDLTNRLLEPGKISHGFLFFFNPDPAKNPFQGATLFIPRIEEEGTRKSVGPFSIPLNPALAAAD